MEVTHSPRHKSALSVNTPPESCDSVSVTLDFINTPPLRICRSAGQRSQGSVTPGVISHRHRPSPSPQKPPKATLVAVKVLCSLRRPWWTRICVTAGCGVIRVRLSCPLFPSVGVSSHWSRLTAAVSSQGVGVRAAEISHQTVLNDE